MNERTTEINRLKAVIMLACIGEGGWAVTEWNHFCELAKGFRLSAEETKNNEFLSKALTAMRAGVNPIIAVVELREFWIADLTGVVEAADRILGDVK